MSNELSTFCEQLPQARERLPENPKEENVKQKIVIPLLEALGHRGKLTFEQGVGKEIDIFLEDLPKGSQVIVETKRLGEDLDKWIDRLESYYRSADALIAVISNGDEFRIYSKIHGFYFGESMLYRFTLSELCDSRNLVILEQLLSRKSLRSGEAFKAIEARVNEIRYVYNDIHRMKESVSQENIERNEKIAALKTDIERERQAIREANQKLKDEVDSYFQVLGLLNPTGSEDADEQSRMNSYKNGFVVQTSRARPSKGYAFKEAILEILVEAGGKLDSKEVVKRIGRRFEGQLTEYDLEKEASGQIRWVHYVHAARQHLVNSGLLVRDTPRAEWEISEQGKRYLRSKVRG